MNQEQQKASAPLSRSDDDLDPAVARRLIDAREALVWSQDGFAAQMGVSRRAYQRYEAGERSPKLRHLQGLAEIGVNVHWLLTGKGRMLTEAEDNEAAPPPAARPEAPAASIDGDLMGRIVDTIRAVYKAEGQGIPDRSLGEMAAEWYGTITSQAATPGDRLDALAEHQIALRRRLRAAATHPTTDKRPA